jgi:hypothetical protein
VMLFAVRFYPYDVSAAIAATEHLDQPGSDAQGGGADGGADGGAGSGRLGGGSWVSGARRERRVRQAREAPQ